MIEQIISINKKFGTIENNIATVNEWISITLRDPVSGSIFVEMLQNQVQRFEDDLRILQERNVIPGNLDLNSTTHIIFALASEVKIMTLLGEDDDEIKKWWISSVKRLLEVPKMV